MRLRASTEDPLKSDYRGSTAPEISEVADTMFISSKLCAVYRSTGPDGGVNTAPPETFTDMGIYA